MITTNVLHRVFRLRFKGKYGTCFTIDIDNKQYLITAKHLLEGITRSDRIEIYYNNTWAMLDVVLLGTSDSEVDVAVLRPSIQLSPDFPLEATIGGILLAQDAYFLGFPYGIGADVGELNRDFPVPFIKKCIISLITDDSTEGRIIYLDGYNNPGFSGGPVIFCNPAIPVSDLNPYKVAAIIKGFRREDEPVYDNTGTRTHLNYRYNTGIVVSYGINHAVDIIRSNPDGFPIVENGHFSE
jgi:hypothetical protein